MVVISSSDQLNGYILAITSALSASMARKKRLNTCSTGADIAVLEVRPFDPPGIVHCSLSRVRLIQKRPVSSCFMKLSSVRWWSAPIKSWTLRNAEAGLTDQWGLFFALRFIHTNLLFRCHQWPKTVCAESSGTSGLISIRSCSWPEWSLASGIDARFSCWCPYSCATCRELMHMELFLLDRWQATGLMLSWLIL